MKNTNLPYNVMNHANHRERAPRDPISVYLATQAAAGFALGSLASVVVYYGVYALSTIAISMVTSALVP